MGIQKLLHVLSLTALMSLPLGAKAGDLWGCEVLLCLANPAGPMAASACVPPIQRLYAALSKRPPDPFPTCEEANTSTASAKPGQSYFDLCPAGTRALSAGTPAVQLSRTTFNALAKANPSLFGADLPPDSRLEIQRSPTNVGIGEGDGMQPAAIDQPLPPKVCVAGELGRTVVPGSSYDDPARSVTAFERIITMMPTSGSRFIDIYLDGQLKNRVRY